MATARKLPGRISRGAGAEGGDDAKGGDGRGGG
jgi:hypothetical protein